MPRAQAQACIAELKAAQGPDLLNCGSHLLYNGRLVHGLVDELRLLVGNVLLGERVPSFTPGLAHPRVLLDQRLCRDRTQ